MISLKPPRPASLATFLAVLVAGATTVARAQDTLAIRKTPVPWALWAALAEGVHTAGYGMGVVAVTAQARQRIYSLRFAIVGGPPCDASDCFPYGIDLSVLMGYGTRVGKLVQLSGAAGVGVANSGDNGGIGLAGEVQASLRPTRFVGVGIYGFGNTVGPQCGVSVGIQIGRFR
jgi:hypothetical protein